ncbi:MULTISPECIES: MBL fold metallo-hydrolase [Vibrio]|nr:MULTISPECIES: MBL fold metallo-hydrolase [Vibrio]
MRFIQVLIVACISAMMAFPSVAAEGQSRYTIEQMKGNVYRFTAGHYRSVFMVTKQGILVTDPINPSAASWLKQELKKRYHLPIRYMIYSHNHVDHSLGGDKLADADTIVVGQELAAEDMKFTQLPTRLPDVTFGDHLHIKLGDSDVELKYYGVNNGRGNVSMHFMPANVMFVVDWVVLGRMPYKDLQGYDIQGMIDSTEALLNGPKFDLLVGGHAEAGDRKDVEHYLGYLKALYAKVRDGMLAGKDLKTLQKEITLPEYSNLKMYKQWLPENIAGVYRTLIDQSYFNFRPDIHQ